MRRLLAALLCLGAAAHAWIIQIDADTEECFHNTLKQGTKVAVFFQVASGGFLDIDVKARGLRARARWGTLPGSHAQREGRSRACADRGAEGPVDLHRRARE